MLAMCTYNMAVGLVERFAVLVVSHLLSQYVRFIYQNQKYALSNGMFCVQVDTINKKRMCVMQPGVV